MIARIDDWKVALKAFRSEPWVEEIVRKSVEFANQYEANEQWLKCLRIYSALSSLEPSKPEWKDKLKLATRRISVQSGLML